MGTLSTTKYIKNSSGQLAEENALTTSAGLLEFVETAIASLPEPQRSAAQIEWEYSTTIERHSPMLQVLAPALGLSEAQLDALFTQGAAL